MQVENKEPPIRLPNAAIGVSVRGAARKITAQKRK